MDAVFFYEVKMDQNDEKTGEIVLYQPEGAIKLEVRVENETVWLNRQQIALLFNRDIRLSASILQMHFARNVKIQLSQNLRQLPKMVKITRLNIMIWT